MPQLWTELECPKSELTAGFFRATAMYRESLRELAFEEVGFKKLKHLLNPNYRDDGGINLLDRNSCHFAQVIYNRSYFAPPVDREREQVVVAFTAVFARGTLSYTNNVSTAFDSIPNHAVVRIASDDVPLIYRRFVSAVQKRKATPLCFANRQALCDWFDANAREALESRVRRGLFVRMDDEEVAVARRRMPPSLPNT